MIWSPNGQDRLRKMEPAQKGWLTLTHIMITSVSPALNNLRILLPLLPLSSSANFKNLIPREIRATEERGGEKYTEEIRGQRQEKKKKSMQITVERFHEIFFFLHLLSLGKDPIMDKTQTTNRVSLIKLQRWGYDTMKRHAVLSQPDWNRLISSGLVSTRLVVVPVGSAPSF